MILNEPCQILSGVGTQLAKRLNKCGIISIQDLILHLPFRYQDRTHITPIRDLRPHDWAVVFGKIVHVQLKKRRRAILECTIEDKTGLLKVRFFHFYAHQLDSLKPGAAILLFGEVRTHFPVAEMIHPEYHIQATDLPIQVDETLTPIYSTTEGLSQTRLRALIKQALTLSKEALEAIEWMDKPQLNTLQIYPFHQAITHLHHPPSDTPLASLENAQHPAMKRLIFEELLTEKISMAFARAKRKERQANPCRGDESIITAFIKQLPFTLTNAQSRVLNEIQQDLAQRTPMLRLIQGDVGSGKTIVAALAALRVILSGFQVALMVPTDLLSEQHEKNMRSWFEPLGITVQRLHGKLNAKPKKQILEALANGHCQCVIGTHALFQEKVSFHQLGLVIIDEQHRFGVEQRIALIAKGQTTPHQLLMTATPIPRTLRMTQWAYLDVSIIDELPPNRTPVVTAVMPQEKREAILHRLVEAIQSGRQAYWVCPLIEISEKLQAQAATETYEALQKALPHLRIALVHGRMKAIEKEQHLIAFKKGEIDLLVATTVIEVGVDVPNASLMFIENAERMGLAQLHQLRGRVGRGNIASYCILLYQTPLSPEGSARLKTLRETTDGFIIAEQDLRLRGAGELLGTRQTGYKRYKIANPSRDEALLPDVSKIAHSLINTHPEKARLISERWRGQVDDYLRG